MSPAKAKSGSLKVKSNEVMERSIGNYQIGDILGRGAFGVVYQGLDITTGHTVAIKRLEITNMGKADLASIETEIILLKQLVHPNIVRYVDTIRSDTHLNIVLEYIENGSLSNILSKYGGQFPESLVAIYMSQVLTGLMFLHNEGVIHRDIKGANILATKDGVMKLADFGVATHLNEASKSDSVVGTPYWMAPEIIEMSGQMSTACDIWSVGCTTVEILTSAPPYFDLQPMTALFRIVQDEHPPIPPGVSPALRDFLLQCFQKDPNLRISAEDLLKHPWLRSTDTSQKRNEAFVSRMNPMDLSAEVIQNTVKMSFQQLQDTMMDTSAASTVRLKSIDAIARTPPSKSRSHRAMDESDSAGSSGWGTDDSGTMEDDGSVVSLDLGQGDTIRLSDVCDIDEERSEPSAGSQHSEPKKAEKGLAAFQESDSDEDLGIEVGTIDASALVARKQAAAWSDDEFDDEFSDDAGFDVFDLDADEKARQSAEVLALVASLTPKQKSAQVVLTCERLLQIFEQDPSQISSVMTTHGVIPIMEMMEVSQSEVILTILKVVNQIILAHPRFLQSLCMVGLIPSVYRLIHWKYPINIRLEAGKFIKMFCSSDRKSKNFCRKMFIACGGLSALVHFMDGTYEEAKELMAVGVDCIYLIFETPNHPKNDFCRLFTKFGLLHPLVVLLRNFATDRKWRSAAEYSRKVANLFLIFSEGDSTVKSFMIRQNVLKALLALTASLEPDVLVHIVKAIRILTMDPHSLDRLEECGAIPRLIPLLNSAFSDIQNQVIQAMYYILQVKLSRLEQAAIHGIVPHLQRIIRTNHPLKEFAFPVLCKLSHAGPRALYELKKYDGVNFYLDLLTQHHWQSFALDSLAVWLATDRPRVEMIILRQQNVIKVFNVFEKTEKSVFDSVLNSFIKMMALSSKLNLFFGRSEAFTKLLAARLSELSEAFVLKPLLVLAQQLFEELRRINDARIKAFTLQLFPVLQRLEGTDKVLVHGLSRLLLAEFGEFAK
eukprot:226905_1